MGEIREQSLSGLKWSAIERFSMQGITFVLGLVMARLLTPADYGVIGMLSIFIAISQTFIDSGFGNALIRKLDRTEADFCTVFYFNIVVSAACYLILFFAAPFIADFFNYPILKDILRVIAINLCINSFSSVQSARFVIAVDFKTIAKCSLASTAISGVIGILLAYNGFGVWALVYQQIGGSVISGVLLWRFSHWRPKLIYSWKSFNDLFSFGSKLLFAGLLHTVYSNMTALVIGKFYTPKDLGNYSRGESLVTLPCSNIAGVLQRVAFPIFTKLQNDDQRLISVYRKYIAMSSLVLFFVMLVLAALVKPVILLLLTAKWEGAVVYAQVLCFAWMFDHICGINLNILQVKGRSDLFLKLEVIKKTISLTMVIAAIPFGVLAICISRVVYTQVALIINTYYTGKLFGLGYFTQIKDYGIYFIYALLAALPAYLLSLSDWHPAFVIALGGVTSLLVYYAILRLKRDAYANELYCMVKSKTFGKH